MSELNLFFIGAAWLALVGIGALVCLRSQDKRLRQRLQRAGGPLRNHAAAHASESGESILRVTEDRSWFTWLWRIIELRYPLVNARRTLVIAILIGLAAGVGSWLSMWFLRVSVGWWTVPFIGLVGTVFACSTVSWLHTHQTTKFIRQFPEIVDQIVRLAGAGVPPLEAISVVASDAQAPVEPILRRVCDGLVAGLDAETTLRIASRELRIAEFTLFAAVIRLQRRAGGGISVAFTNLATTLRERRSTALKARASTAQTRLTLLVLTLMPILVLLGQKFIAPESIEVLFNTEQGIGLLRWGIGLIVTGLLVARGIAVRGER